jgi:hypothetical protein
VSQLFISILKSCEDRYQAICTATGGPSFNYAPMQMRANSPCADAECDIRGHHSSMGARKTAIDSNKASTAVKAQRIYESDSSNSQTSNRPLRSSTHPTLTPRTERSMFNAHEQQQQHNPDTITTHNERRAPPSKEIIRSMSYILPVCGPHTPSHASFSRTHEPSVPHHTLDTGLGS